MDIILVFGIRWKLRTWVFFFLNKNILDNLSNLIDQIATPATIPPPWWSGSFLWQTLVLTYQCLTYLINQILILFEKNIVPTYFLKVFSSAFLTVQDGIATSVLANKI